jgi:hypothetical protein
MNFGKTVRGLVGHGVLSIPGTQDGEAQPWRFSPASWGSPQSQQGWSGGYELVALLLG